MLAIMHGIPWPYKSNESRMYYRMIIVIVLNIARDSTLRNSTGCVIMSLATCDLITGLIAVPTVIMSMLDHLPFFKQGIHFLNQLKRCSSVLMDKVASFLLI